MTLCSPPHMESMQQIVAADSGGGVGVSGGTKNPIIRGVGNKSEATSCVTDPMVGPSVSEKSEVSEEEQSRRACMNARALPSSSDDESDIVGTLGVSTVAARAKLW